MTGKKWKWMALPVFAACTFVALPGIGQVKAPGPPSPPTQNVLVVNGSGLPVPTTAQGTTNVAGTVNIGNAPNVNVTNTPSVIVTNPATTLGVPPACFVSLSGPSSQVYNCEFSGFLVDTQ